MAMTEDEVKELQTMVKNIVNRFTPGRSFRGRKPVNTGIVNLSMDEVARLEELANA